MLTAATAATGAAAMTGKTTGKAGGKAVAETGGKVAAMAGKAAKAAKAAREDISWVYPPARAVNCAPGTVPAVIESGAAAVAASPQGQSAPCLAPWSCCSRLRQRWR